LPGWRTFRVPPCPLVTLQKIVDNILQHILTPRTFRSDVRTRHRWDDPETVLPITRSVCVCPDSNFKFAQSLFVGTGLAITAVPVAIRVLMDLGKLESRVGQVIVSAAVFDDILSFSAIVIVAVVTTVAVPIVLRYYLPVHQKES